MTNPSFNRHCVDKSVNSCCSGSVKDWSFVSYKYGNVTLSLCYRHLIVRLRTSKDISLSDKSVKTIKDQVVCTRRVWTARGIDAACEVYYSDHTRSWWIAMGKDHLVGDVPIVEVDLEALIELRDALNKEIGDR